MRELDLAMDIAFEIMKGLEAVDRETPIPEGPTEAASWADGHPKTTKYIEYLASEGFTLREQVRLAEMGAKATQMKEIEQALKGLYARNNEKRPHRHSIHPDETTLRRYQRGRLRIATPPQLILTPIPPLPLLRAG